MPNRMTTRIDIAALQEPGISISSAEWQTNYVPSKVDRVVLDYPKRIAKRHMS